MIITYPTGLYDSVLPHKPSDSQNVTFLISTTIPPRTSLLFPKIPVGVALRQKLVDPLTPLERRQTVGDLVFTISRAVRQQTGNNSTQYELGAVLEFDNVFLKTTDPMLVSVKTEIQHNLNMFDYAELGLTPADVAVINENSFNTFDIITQRLNQLRVVRADAEVQINTSQKLINDANRNIIALEVMLGSVAATDSDIEELIAKLQNRKQLAQAELQQAVDVANASAAASSVELAKLRAVAVVLK